MDADGSVRDQLPSAYPGSRHSLFLMFGKSEKIVGQVHGEILYAEREWRDTPPLDWPLTRDRWNANETGISIFCVGASNEIPAGGPSEMTYKR